MANGPIFLLAAVCAVISEAGSWATVVEWSEMKPDWLRQQGINSKVLLAQTCASRYRSSKNFAHVP